MIFKFCLLVLLRYKPAGLCSMLMMEKRVNVLVQYLGPWSYQIPTPCVFRKSRSIVDYLNFHWTRKSSCGKPHEAYRPHHNLSRGVPQSQSGDTPVLVGGTPGQGYPLARTGYSPVRRYPCQSWQPYIGLLRAVSVVKPFHWGFL